MGKIKVGIIGLGNCASSLIQGIHYYSVDNTIGLSGHDDIEIYPELYKLCVQAYAGRFLEYWGDPDQHNTGKKENDMIIYV